MPPVTVTAQSPADMTSGQNRPAAPAPAQTPDRQSAPSERPPQSSQDATGTTQDGSPQAPDPRQAELARREQMLRRESRRVSAEKQELAAIRAENERLKAWQTRLTTDPHAVLSEVGLSGDQITESILNAPSAEENRLRKIESENKALRDAQEAAQTASYEQAKTQIRREASQLVSSDAAFETIKAMNATEAIVELIEQTFLAPEDQGGGYIMSIEEAAREVEEYLVNEALKVARIEKIRSRLSPAQQQHAQQSSAPPPQQQQRNQGINTLSNRHTPTTVKPSTDKERRERAILAFMGKLQT